MATLLAGGRQPVHAAQKLDGTEPALGFINDLDDKDKRRVLRLFEKKAAGHALSPEDFRKLRDGLFEFKDFQIRMPCFSTPKGWFVTHGFIKKKEGRTPESEIARADLIRSEFLKRPENQAKGTKK